MIVGSCVGRVPGADERQVFHSGYVIGVGSVDVAAGIVGIQRFESAVVPEKASQNFCLVVAAVAPMDRVRAGESGYLRNPAGKLAAGGRGGPLLRDP
jgi:hypothetical protein